MIYSMQDQDTPQQEPLQAGTENQSASNPLLIPIAIIIAGALIGGSVLYSNSGRPTAAPQLGAIRAGKAVDNTELLKQAQTDLRTLGNPDAPVVIVEFADFQCPFCGKFFRESGTKIIEQYVKAGKARFVYRDFAFLGPESTAAAEASRCAGDQNAFWQYHDYLYTHQQGENQGAFSKERLKEFATVLNLDTATFNSCLDAGVHRDQVQKDLDLGRSLGVDGTPATFVNDQSFNGALPYEQFQVAIEAELVK